MYCLPYRRTRHQAAGRVENKGARSMSAQTVPRFETSQEDTGVSLRLLTRPQYHRLADAGIFGSAKVELIDGVVNYKHTGEPWLWSRKSYHAAAEMGLF